MSKSFIVKLAKSEGMDFSELPTLVINIDVSLNKHNYILRIKHILVNREIKLDHTNEFHKFEKALKEYSDMNYENYSLYLEKLEKATRKIIDRIYTVSLYTRESIIIE